MKRRLRIFVTVTADVTDFNQWERTCEVLHTALETIALDNLEDQYPDATVTVVP